MKKRNTIIYALVGAVVVGGVVVSRFVDWSVDDENASGNIAKSSHFSRKTADDGVGNMQELLQNDEEYKNGVVTAYMVMKTRAEQFNALVDMSVEVASGIKEFEIVLAEMNEIKPMVDNVCASMETAGKDLDSVLGGETSSNLEQNTANAALAYNTLQKQNKLADLFIEAVDKCQKKEDINDRLKFVRDQWVNYQQVTAALSQNKELSEELNKKGYLLSADKQAVALGSFDKVHQLADMCGIQLASMCGVNGATDLSNTISGLDNNLEGALNNQLKTQNNMLIRSMNGMDQLQNSFQGAIKDISDKGILGNTNQMERVINSLARPGGSFQQEVQQ